MRYDEMNAKDRVVMEEKDNTRAGMASADLPRMFRREAPSLSMVRKEKRDKRKMER